MSEISPELLEILQCPVTGQPLRVASVAELQQLKSQTRTALDSVLICGPRAYPVIGGIPHLRPQDAIMLTDL